MVKYGVSTSYYGQKTSLPKIKQFEYNLLYLTIPKVLKTIFEKRLLCLKENYLERNLL